MAENEKTTAVAPAPEEEPVKKVKKERKASKIKVGQVIAWIVIFLLFLVITNPSMLFFLPEETRGELQGTWMRIFGDVTKISDTFQFNWATIFQVIPSPQTRLPFASVGRWVDVFSSSRTDGTAFPDS